MKMTGMVAALEHQEEQQGFEELSFHERLNLLVDSEYTKRQHNRLQRLINQARFRDSHACVEDVNYNTDRKLDRDLILDLASCNYIPHANNIIIVGATGAGKSYLAQALGQAACRKLISTKYIHLSDLLDGSFVRCFSREDQKIREDHCLSAYWIIDHWFNELHMLVRQDGSRQGLT